MVCVLCSLQHYGYHHLSICVNIDYTTLFNTFTSDYTSTNTDGMDFITIVTRDFMFGYLSCVRSTIAIRYWKDISIDSPPSASFQFNSSLSPVLVIPSLFRVFMEINMCYCVLIYWVYDISISL